MPSAGSGGNYYVKNRSYASNTSLELAYDAATDSLKAYANDIEKPLGDNLPIGTILPYWGDLTLVPAKWHLCDGTAGTPDLRDRFFTGAGSSYPLGYCAGENFHTLSIYEMPSHNHSLNYHPANLGNGWENNNGGAELSMSERALINVPTYTDYNGYNQPHENRPPFCAVYYIMKVLP